MLSRLRMYSYGTLLLLIVFISMTQLLRNIFALKQQLRIQKIKDFPSHRRQSPHFANLQIMCFLWLVGSFAVLMSLASIISLLRHKQPSLWNQLSQLHLRFLYAQYILRRFLLDAEKILNKFMPKTENQEPAVNEVPVLKGADKPQVLEENDAQKASLQRSIEARQELNQLLDKLRLDARRWLEPTPQELSMSMQVVFHVSDKNLRIVQQSRYQKFEFLAPEAHLAALLNGNY